MEKKEEVKLLGTRSSPFTLRAVWALKLKGVEYELIEEDISNKSALLLTHNPVHKKIPVLVHNGKPIVESSVIVEYIDETWKQNPLLPDDPYDRAFARFWIKFGDEKLLSSIWSAFVKQGSEQEEALVVAKENLKILEEQLHGKKFFGGEVIGIVDIFMGWLAYLVSVFDELNGLKLIDEDKFPLLSSWIETFYSSPIIKDTWPSRPRLISRYKLIQEQLRSETTSTK